MTDRYILGYDFGTSSVKAALFGRNGEVIATAQAAYPLLLPQPGWAEQEPQQWWAAMGTATRQLLADSRITPQSIEALGVSAQMAGTLPVDSEGNALHNALIWLDTRSAPIARRITGGFPKLSGYGLFPLLRWLRLTNGAPNLSGKDPISKMLWLREQRPEIWRKTHKLLDVKDYLVQRLCGAFVTSEDCAHLTWLMDTRPGKRCWSDALLKRQGIDRHLLPELARPADPVGRLGEAAAHHLGLAQGTNVVAGCGDVTSCALSAGDLNTGALHIHLGTSDWIAGHLERRAVDIFTGVATVCGAEADRYLLIAAQESAGACVDWACRALGFGNSDEPDYHSFDAAAAEAAPGADGLLFLPWLYGERVPVDDHLLRGGYANLNLTHGRSEMARAVLEGVALNARWALGPTERITGKQGAIRLLGGGAKSELWCQILADVLQRPILQMDKPELGGCRGAAMAAATGNGWFPNLTEAGRMSPVARRFEPNAALAPRYKRQFDAFSAYYRRTRRWYHALHRSDERQT